MKILKLSTNKGGGATIAAERQAVALRELGCNVKHLFIDQCWEGHELTLEEFGHNVHVKPHMPTYIKTDLLFQKYLENNRTPVSNTYMSLWKTKTEFDTQITDYIFKNGFDVVHFHWASNLISTELLARLSEKKLPVVITGHDMNHFTGTCHYDAGCGKHQELCSGCTHLENDPYLLIEASHREKKKAIEVAQPTYVFPSDWLNEEYKASAIGQSLGDTSSVVIRNCLDTDYFSPADPEKRVKLRNEFGFAADEIIVVSGAENNHEIRKGFNYFEDAVKKINTAKFGHSNKSKIKFVAFGGGDHVLECNNPDIKYVHLGVLKEAQVRDLFRSADLLAFTSIEENFANVILESLMCGCPVLGFDLGGIPDIVRAGINGELVIERSERAYSSALSKLVLNSDLHALRESTLVWRSKNSDKYSKKHIATQLLDFYHQLGGGA
ncbi:glycosyltransferase [Vibrio sp. 10N]|uniref:glycosyltransferase n=1 Tax=Vibrio sp. 10N TaxID=3058938 RepID=UPI0028134DC1|nr:hypothetical protein VB10N_28910 [Vibrio sp. 10N]